jgi:nitrous oxidase accessory protein
VRIVLIVFACFILLTIVFVSNYVRLLPREAVKAWRVHDLNSGLNYTTIQGAINAQETVSGHVLLVDEGSYAENVVVSKSLTIKSDGQVNKTIVQAANSKAPAFSIASDNVSLEGFSVEGSSTYVSPAGRTAVEIRMGGIMLSGCKHCDVFNNICFDNSYGILVRADENSVHDNTCTDNGGGIFLLYAHNNTISRNLSFRNTFGISIESSYYNLVSKNSLYENTADAISLYSAENTDPNLAKKNTILGNEIVRNDVAISLYASVENNITQNNVSYNNYMFSLSYVNGDLIYQNNFVDNAAKAFSVFDPHGNVRFDDGITGNYWGSYNGMPCIIDDHNQDNHPLTNPYTSGD